ncbi:sensor histidine kinase [Actinoplanes teichomyceticus]|uniref:histidine kinase n=1 Tax=Actinoplanes teichomyceticus TaxID=1867 RepID=A0A561W9I0_ACTTI|nr:sensor histidine kinase [Actinoplanes teichomyceticus]TWG20508.1 signal transduction histidine kinase [Actinoplanes teichomyceticus]GIF15840.1 histidine kinase [Actinoplanes teichomyceticus]
MPVRTALDALTLRPTVFLRSAWPWRSLLYLSGGALLGFGTILVVIALVLVGAVLSIVVIGLAAYVATVLCGVAVARMERRRMRLVDFDELPDPHRPAPRAGLRAWLRLRLREQATWRELGYAMMSAGLLCWMDSLVVAGVVWIPAATLGAPFYMVYEPLGARLLLGLAGIPLTVVLAWPVTAWAGARAAMARAILAPRAHDADEKLIEVTRSRARLVDAFEVERRRIERDLHDGAQQRLVALSIQLGMARLELPPDSPATGPVAAAHDLAKQALTELRQLIRGVHPKVLTDRGLAAAAGDAASSAPLPVELDFALSARLPVALEATAYFVIAEALTNVTKHSGASRAWVSGRLDQGRLIVEIRDDGCGGADPSAGTGLVGLADRVAVVDGTVALASPPGGPTVLRAEIPLPPEEGETSYAGEKVSAPRHSARPSPRDSDDAGVST